MQPVLPTRQKSRKTVKARRLPPRAMTAPYTPIDFECVEKKASAFVDLIESRSKELSEILLKYESHEVVEDETARTLDLLRNIHENKNFFRLRVNEVAAFLPRNQPLYAFTCFVLVPALMAREVHFRIPQSMRGFFPELLSLLEIAERFPNVTVSPLTRLEFLRERTALRVNPKSGQSLPVTDAVIFTGTSQHAEQLRMIFDNRTLFISNGSGHNPVVVSSDADISAACEAVLTLQLYNQGQDCAAPNAILVHSAIAEEFAERLREGIRAVRVGAYHDRDCRVGPISDPKDLVRIQDFLMHHQDELDSATPGIIRSRDAIVEPTIIHKPLKEGGNYGEIFAPIVMFQRYNTDAELANYFENRQYAQNAMYVTLYGTSAYVSKKLVGMKFEGRMIHDAKSLLHNSHLHEPGKERGTKPYGGYGQGASSLTINGKTTFKPTLPQRDIYQQIVVPLLRSKGAHKRLTLLSQLTKIQEKNVEKLLRITAHEIRVGGGGERASDSAYLDLHKIATTKDGRYAELDVSTLYRVLPNPNATQIASLTADDMAMIRKVPPLLAERSTLTPEDFTSQLYALARKLGSTEVENRSRQRLFFRNLYQLLFGQDSGPRLPQFLYEVDSDKLLHLLDI